MTATRAPRARTATSRTATSRPATARPATARADRRPAGRGPSARPLPQGAAGPRLRLVPPPERGWGPLVLFCVVAFLVTVAAAVFVQGERISAQERSDRLGARITRAEEQSRRLRVELARAESPENVLGAARALGMVEPAPSAAVPAVPIDATTTTTPDPAVRSGDGTTDAG